MGTIKERIRGFVKANPELTKGIVAMLKENPMILTELHLHTDAYANKGIGDGAQTVAEAVNASIETFDALLEVLCEEGFLTVDEAKIIKGHGQSFAVTDHGNMINTIDQYNYCTGGETSGHEKLPKDAAHIKPIVGVEAYVTTEGYYVVKTGNAEVDALATEVLKGKEIMQHLVILAKNYKGFQQISRYVSETNRHVDDMGRPIGTEEMLQKFFGPDAQDSGNVIAMSACVGGVLATPLAFNNKIDHEIEKIDNRIGKSKSLIPAEYFDSKGKVAKVTARINELTAEIEALAEKAGKKFKDTKARIKAETDETVKKYLTDRLAIEEAETKAAKESIVELKKEIQALKASVSDDKKIITKHKNKAATIDANLEKIEALNAAKKSAEQMTADETEALQLYVSIFGADNFYAEVQYHGDELEAEVYPQIAKIARANNVKLVATNDVHMARPEDLQKRMLLKNCTRIKTGQWSGPIESDSELYYKTVFEKAEMLAKILPEDMVMEAIEGIADIVNKCDFKLPETKANASKGITEEMVAPNLHYPEFKDADTKLRELCLNGSVVVETVTGKVIEVACPGAGIAARYGSRWNDEMQKRFDYELETIRNMKVASYHLFIADVIGKCKSARENAMDIGPGRGSGAGSVVCYLSGITELEPVSLGLLFERYLNPERVSMPK